MIVDQLWKRRLFSEVAPINTPQRIQVETRCKHLREILESGDLHRISRYCRRLCYRLKRRGFCDLWLDHANNPEVIGLPKTEFIRDMDVNENKIVCAIENDIIVYSRNQIL